VAAVRTLSVALGLGQLRVLRRPEGLVPRALPDRRVHPAGAANVQFALGAIDACGFWCGIYGSGSCHSHAPLIDQVKFYRLAFAGPQWNVRDIDLFPG